jgi:anti-anti-sigma regulatory factor
MIEVAADKTRNLLKITFSKHVDPEETRNTVEKAKALLAELQPGFRLLTDLTRLESMDVACAAHLRQVMDCSNRKGVEKVVRVIPDPHKDIGLNILSLFHYRRAIPIVTCASLKEAMTVLAG